MSQAKTHPTLVVTGGDLDGTSFIVLESAREMLLGSSQDCHFQILLGNVEPVHAKVAWTSKGLVLTDALSSTGTFVNGEKTSEGQVLSDGDRICLGPPGSKSSCKLLVRIPTDLVLPTDNEDLILVKPESGLAPVDPDAFVSRPLDLGAEEAEEPPNKAPLAPPPPHPSIPPPPPSPPSPAAPESAPQPAASAKKAPRPEYVTEPPSIAPEREGEAPSPPQRPPRTSAKPAAKAAPKPARSRLALYVVAGLALAGALVFAFRIFFAKAPVVSSVSPTRSEPGQTVSVSGQGFDTSLGGNKVRIGEREAQVTSATGETLAVAIPADLAIPPGGDAPIVVERGGKKSAPFPFKLYRAPRVSGLEPDVAMSGEEILIKGQNLDGKPLTVNIGGQPAEVKEAVPASVRVVVPELKAAQGKVVPVSVQIGPDSARPADLIVGYLPLVVEIKPERGHSGDKVVIKGRGFDSDAEDNEVYFGNQPALILAASETELSVVAPASPVLDAPLATSQVHVKANGAISSSPVMFTQLRPSASQFVLRFYASAVLAHPQFAFVSTDLAPVMVLGGGESGAKATAARALAVATALNQLAEGTAGELPVFEVRSQPETSVGVVGREAPIVNVTAEDAAAYELPFEPGVKARRPTVKGLAAYWAALLQDYFGLFAKKQRPVAALALSPRARVLSDIYSAAQRVPGAVGVPLSVVRPLSPSMARALREMALLLPAEKERQVNVAVEGLWTGTMEEGSGGTKAVQVRFTQKAGKLGGNLATRAGKVELNTPLRAVTFQRNEVRFQVDLQGAARAFTGTLSGGTLSGTIAKGADKTAGRFTLTYVE